MSEWLDVNFDVPKKFLGIFGGWSDAQIAAYERMLLVALSAAAHAEIVRLAMANLHSTKGTYIHAIQPAVFARNTATITLQGAFPNMLEQGCEAFDLIDTLLMKNKKKKLSKDGHWYASIPFGQAVGSMPAHVANTARKLEPTKTALGAHMTLWGGKAPEDMVPRRKQHHATDQYHGMVRQETTYKASTQSTFKTFRTISDKARETGMNWMFPGLEARNFFPQTSAFLDRHAEAIVSSIPLPR